MRIKDMTNYIYNSHGQAVGFWSGRYVYKLNGTPVGQINGIGNIGHPGNPGNAGNPGNPGNRGAVNYGYRDVFEKLLED